MALTHYPEGSLRELAKLSLPLMLSSLSVLFMIFVDRLFLANYSTQALNAVANAMTLGWAFVYSWMILTSIGEVFVAQYNGAGQKQNLGEPIWQMIWLSAFSLFFFVPIGIWGTSWIYGNSPDQEMEKEYFKWMIFFGPSFPLYGALCGFFIGQGKTTLVTCVAIIANLVNVCLDFLLIFGLEGYLEPLGVTGAAIATSGSSVFQSLILGAVFLNQKNREEFGTNQYALQLKSLWQCIKIGTPNAVFVSIELLGWASFYFMMTLVGEHYITVAGINQSVVILLYFFAEGVSKAASTISGNLIGAQRSFAIPKVLLSGVRLHLLFFLLLALLFFFSSDWIIVQFLPTVESHQLASLQGSLKTTLFFMCLYILFEGIRLLFAGILTAAGDTLFLLVVGSLSVWVFLVLPVYFFIVHIQWPVEAASFICVLYSLTACILYVWRFTTGKWKTISIIAES
jgi:MATE family multidrug resistance protein